MILNPSHGLLCGILLLEVLTKVDSFDFCSSKKEKDFCARGKRSIVCNPESAPMAGTFLSSAPMTPKLMKDLLSFINTIRENVASGRKLDAHGHPFPQAASMREVIWDAQLEYVASHRAKRCNIKASDVCHSSPKYPNAAEINSVYGSADRINISISLSSIFGNISQQGSEMEHGSLITTTHLTDHRDFASDFTILVNDQASRVGCSLAYCHDCRDKLGNSQKHCYFLTCIFDEKNVNDCSVYEAAKFEATESCDQYRTGRSGKYQSLCRNNDRNFRNRCLKPDENVGDFEEIIVDLFEDEPNTEKIPPIDYEKYGYCQPQWKEKICAFQNASLAHIACKPDQLEPMGELIALHRLKLPQRVALVNQHNKYRNLVASGTDMNEALSVRYPAASRMCELIWDKELEHIAEIHARSCHFGPSKCHNTKEFRAVGQNLGFLSKNSDFAEEAILSVGLAAVDKWYMEKNNVRNMDGFRTNWGGHLGEGKEIRHFSQMVNDQITRMGCAVAFCKDCQGENNSISSFCALTTCQYDFTPLTNFGIYKKGPVTTLCMAEHKRRRSRRYPYLCGPKWTFEPKRLWNANDSIGQSITEILIRKRKL